MFSRSDIKWVYRANFHVFSILSNNIISGLWAVIRISLGIVEFARSLPSRSMYTSKMHVDSISKLWIHYCTELCLHVSIYLTMNYRIWGHDAGFHEHNNVHIYHLEDCPTFSKWNLWLMYRLRHLQQISVHFVATCNKLTSKLCSIFQHASIQENYLV